MLNRNRKPKPSKFKNFGAKTRSCFWQNVSYNYLRIQKSVWIKNDTFWYKILEVYNEEAAKRNFPIRTKNMFTGKWTPMNREITKFNSLVLETRVMSGENDENWMKRVEILYRTQMDARRNRHQVTDEEPELFGDDALPRPPGLQRIAKSQHSSNSIASSGSNPTMFQEMLQQQYELDRKEKMKRIDREQLESSYNTHDDRSQNSGEGPGRPMQPARVCSYIDFMKCQPLNFKGTEGVVGLSRWFEKMESVFYISGCAIDNQVKFTTCTLLGVALTWWNGHVRTLGHDAAYAMTWEILKKKLTNKYCPKGEIKKLKIELWNVKVKGNEVGGYTQRFQELALMCTKFLSDETEKVDKYISGLPDNIHGNVMSSRPKTLDDAIELANDLMDQKLRTYAEMQAGNKRKLDNNNQAQQQLLK
ncbi:reverse transcriptase domain-containing protein [Tanacetum coccineum]